MVRTVRPATARGDEQDAQDVGVQWKITKARCRARLIRALVRPCLARIPLETARPGHRCEERRCSAASLVDPTAEATSPAVQPTSYRGAIGTRSPRIDSMAISRRRLCSGSLSVYPAKHACAPRELYPVILHDARAPHASLIPLHCRAVTALQWMGGLYCRARVRTKASIIDTSEGGFGLPCARITGLSCFESGRSLARARNRHDHQD
jgi:hypothetical protein